MKAMFLLVLFLIRGSRVALTPRLRGKLRGIKDPVIGILTKPCKEELRDVECDAMLEARYIRWLEQSGARTVPIAFDGGQTYMDNLLPKINGVFFVGGGDIIIEKGELTAYSLAAKYLLEQAIKANDQGTYFPIWGTCLGFELFAILVSGNQLDELTWCPDDLCVNYSTTLKFVNTTSRMFSQYNQEMFEEVETQNVTFNWHNWMLTKETYIKDDKLSAFFNLNTLSYSMDGSLEFISSLEGKKYPFYATQFHPESNIYDHVMNHNRQVSQKSTRVSQLLSNFFVNECKQNGNHFDQKDEVTSDTNNYPTMYHKSRRLVYLFD